MKIAIIGTGYVGLVAGVCFADSGHFVTCIDNDQKKIEDLRGGKIPIYEPGLEELLKGAHHRMKFSTNLSQAVKDHDIIFSAVGTPESHDGSADMRPTMTVMKEIAEEANAKKFVVLKSTVPIGTAKKIKKFFKENSSFNIEVINNPEFLKEGMAINDFMRPDRVVIGCETQKARELMTELYAPFVRNDNPVIFMGNAAAEMTKYAANSFLAVKISFINELALLADKVEADINEVRQGFTSDKRINGAFFYPGVGFGGSCFPKDVRELIHTGQKFGLPSRIVQAADEVNDSQKLVLVHKVKEHFGSNLKGRTFAIWGLSFKPQTDDVREAPAKYVIEELIKAGAEVKATDPAGIETARSSFGSQFKTSSDPMEILDGADALLIITEWNEFRNPDFSSVKAKLKEPVIFDGRNIFDPLKMYKEGFIYYCIGRQAFAVSGQNRI